MTDIARQLVTIRLINQVLEHPNADALELAIVDGWQCVVRKGEFKPQDTVLFFEVDSVLPVHPAFEFLRKSCFVQRDWVTGFRLKTIRLRGQLSQGLILPITILEQFHVTDFTSGLDVALGVIKWDPPTDLNLLGSSAGNFFPGVPKTDQERVQNIRYQSLIEDQRLLGEDGLWEVTEKLDGSSMTVLVAPDGQLRIASRNFERRIEDGDMFSEAVRKLRFVANWRTLAYQGELIGPGVQGNPYKLTERAFYLFDIYDVDNSRYLSSAERLELAKLNGLNHVPVISTTATLPELRADIIKDADGLSQVANVPREGLVYKKLGGGFSFKVISNAWLLTEEK